MTTTTHHFAAGDFKASVELPEGINLGDVRIDVSYFPDGEEDALNAINAMGPELEVSASLGNVEFESEVEEGDPRFRVVVYSPRDSKVSERPHPWAERLKVIGALPPKDPDEDAA